MSSSFNELLTRRRKILNLLKTGESYSASEIYNRYSIEKLSEKKAYKRTLEQLVDEGELSFNYFTRDGIKIGQEIDSELAKKYIIKWNIIKETPNLIEKENVGRFYFSENIKDFIQIKRNVKQEENGTKDLMFRHSGRFYRIEINTYGFFNTHQNIDEFQLIVSSSRRELQEKHLRNLQKNSEILYLALNKFGKLSSSNEDRAGHFAITFKKSNKIIIKDLNSTHGTSVVPIEKSKIKYALDYINYGTEQTYKSEEIKNFSFISDFKKIDSKDLIEGEQFLIALDPSDPVREFSMILS